MYQQVDLTCIMQNKEITTSECRTGVISKTPQGFYFEEAVTAEPRRLNPKLYDGEMLSMVRRQNGNYQCHLKTMPPNFDRDSFAYKVYSELLSALSNIE